MIQSKQELADYALRANGAPVVNIEVDDEQLSDCVENALQFYAEEHYDGIERDYIKVQVTYLDLENKYITLPDSVFSVIRVVNTASIFTSSDYLFDMKYQVMAGEISKLGSGGVSNLYQTFGYLQHMDYVLRREKTFRFNRRMNRIYLDINWDEIKEDQYLIFEVYIAVDPESYTEVYNDRWLKAYTAALVKRQWGTNLSKYSGMKLPGDITYNGETIYNQAITEIEKLEDEARAAGAPLGMLVG